MQVERIPSQVESPRRRIALVTGASRGIGRAIAVALAKDGALVVGVHFGSDVREAERTADLVRTAGAVPINVEQDFSSGPLAAATGLSREFLGRVKDVVGEPVCDVLVNNVGIAIPERLGEISEPCLRRLFEVNVMTPTLLIQEMAPRIRDGGRVVNVSSALTRIADPRYPAYSSSKAALDALTLSLAPELGRRGITINSVMPGYTATAKIASRLRDPQRRSEAVARSALGRIGTPNDIAVLVSFLAGDGGGWVTGQVLDASGGLDL